MTPTALACFIRRMAGWIIAIASLKGGVGKTTVATTLASRLHLEGHRTLLVDADAGTATARHWGDAAAAGGIDGPPVWPISGAAIGRDVPRAAKDYAVVVVDCPPAFSDATRGAMAVADLVLVPVIPGAANAWALAQTAELLTEARRARPKVKGAIVVNRYDRTALATATVAAASGLGVPVLEAKLGNRVGYGEAMGAGRSVANYKQAGAAAKREAEALAREVLAMLG